MGLADEVLQHLFGHFKVGNHTILHRANCDYVARRTPQHIFGVAADSFDGVRNFVDCYDRRFRNDDAAALGVDKRVRGSEIDCQVTRKKAKE